ncbi:MAG: hypothetical protein JWO13_1958 [Acidobacteriales bacterium]|nr:hypothetical protein [Terriglobales bacterium]
MYRFPRALVSSLAFFLAVAPSFATSNQTQDVVVNSGVPLHIVLDERASYTKVGQPLIGHLSEPVYVFDRLALPSGTAVLGKVVDARPVTKRKRLNALSSGDFTPLREPVVNFYSIILSDGTELPIQSSAAQRDSAVVRMGSAADSKGLWKQLKNTAKGAISNEKRNVDQAIHRPNKLQWAKNSLLARLPYHPQAFDPGTQFVAELQAPLKLRSGESGAANTELLGTPPPADSILRARLITDVSSATSHWGDPVEALLTQPLIVGDRRLILPEGTRLMGKVTRAVPAKRLGKNGQLSFTFRQMILPSGVAQTIKGQLAAADAASNVKMDQEGNTRAAEPKAKYLVPLGLLLLSQSMAENDEDGINGSQPGSANSGIAGNGFGLTGRLIAFTAGSRAFAFGLGYYGASRAIYSRFIARGHDVIFPRNTQVEIKIGAAENQQPLPLR